MQSLALQRAHAALDVADERERRMEIMGRVQFGAGLAVGASSAMAFQVLSLPWWGMAISVATCWAMLWLGARR